ncbi:MAG: hypothetical protein ABEJ99_00815 [Candidatus Nanohaloarchaea archaeon]
MKRLFIVLLLALVILAPTAAAKTTVQEVQYAMNINLHDAYVNTSIVVNCDIYCSGIQWQLPDNSNVLFVNDSGGKADYSVKGDMLSISGHSAAGMDSETYRIGTHIDSNPEEVEKGLYKWRISIPSFSDVKTTGFIHADNLISGWIGFGFDYSFNGDEMKFKGTGPTTVRVNFGKGEQKEYYTVFGNTMEDLKQPYEIPVGTLGVVQDFRRFPVAVMDSGKYDRTVNKWSAGEYIAGSIRVRDNLDEDFVPILAHETVHGLNDRRLRWDGTNSAYFDEGTATYFEYLMKNKLYSDREIDVGPAALFGKDRTYKVKKGHQLYTYTVPSRGDRDELWNYYQDNRDFMKKWNAYDYPQVRDFGYAYSQLIIRNYVANRNGSLREVYRDMDFDHKITDPDVKWRFFSNHMDMTPCDYSSRDRFDACLDRINSYDYPVYSAAPNSAQRELDIKKVEIPNRTRTDYGSSFNTRSIVDSINGFIDWLVSFFNSLGR